MVFQSETKTQIMCKMCWFISCEEGKVTQFFIIFSETLKMCRRNFKFSTIGPVVPHGFESLKCHFQGKNTYIGYFASCENASQDLTEKNFF